MFEVAQFILHHEISSAYIDCIWFLLMVISECTKSIMFVITGQNSILLTYVLTVYTCVVV